MSTVHFSQAIVILVFLTGFSFAKISQPRKVVPTSESPPLNHSQAKSENVPVHADTNLGSIVPVGAGTIRNDVDKTFNAEPNGEEMKDLLQNIKKQLEELEDKLDGVHGDIKDLKCNKNETAFKKNCADLYKSGKKISGVYTIKPDNSAPFDVFCDQTTDGGGWTVFQKRLDGSVDFYRGWDEYKRGFGNLNGEYWLGLDKIHRLTNQERTKLRVELEDIQGNTAYAAYDFFAITSEKTNYQLSLGTYSGTAGDSFSSHLGLAFTTKDRDNDKSSSSNCAVTFKGGWWYGACHASNLNGLYHHGQHSSYADGVNWYHWKGHHYSAKRAEMKIKPVGFNGR